MESEFLVACLYSRLLVRAVQYSTVQYDNDYLGHWGLYPGYRIPNEKGNS